MLCLFVLSVGLHDVQHVVRILAMVPIYATNAWFGLRYKSITLYLDVGRDCYEAFVIYR